MLVLIVEDDRKLAAAMERGLGAAGYAVLARHTAAEGERAAREGAPDLILLDVMLPDGDGVDLCRRLRRDGFGTPILMVTAMSGTRETVTGLDAGADDYLAKPFDFEELLARARSLLRRGRASESTVLGFRDLALDLTRRTADRAGRTVPLSGKEFMLLEYLLRNPDRVLTRQEIAQKVWGLTFEPASNVIDVYVGALRRKLERPGEDRLIHTVIGAGYRFGLPAGSPADGG